MRVCQFRHDGKWTYIAAAALGPPCQETNPSILQSDRELSNFRDRRVSGNLDFLRDLCGFSFAYFAVKRFFLSMRASARPFTKFAEKSRLWGLYYPSFALIVIFAFSTFDTGHPV